MKNILFINLKTKQHERIAFKDIKEIKCLGERNSLVVLKNKKTIQIKDSPQIIQKFVLNHATEIE